MKARVKATGEIVEVDECASRYKERGWDFVSIATRMLYTYAELDFDANNEYPDYWDKLLHQYAGMAMQGIITNPIGFENIRARVNVNLADEVAQLANEFAHALVEKMKEERK